MYLRRATPASLTRVLFSLLVLLCAGAVACSGSRNVGEWGAECSDGKDNDKDGKIDCDDPDCADMPICKQQTDAGRDIRPTSDGKPPPPPDLRLGDRLPPSPDRAPSSSYGQKCSLSSSVCPDGKTVCVPGKASSSIGFCTYGCPGDVCPTPPTGTTAQCLYGYNGQPYCAFLCRFQNTPYQCPGGLGCFENSPPLSFQRWCWPQ